MVGEVAVDGRDDTHQVVWHAADAAEQVNRGLEASAKEASARQKKIADAGRGKVKDRGWRPGAFEDFEIEEVEEGTDQLFLGGGDQRPEW